MGKEKKMDRLTMDSIAAEKAGMSYGKWKAMQLPTVDEPVLNHGPKKGRCKTCGEKVPEGRRVFCCDACLKGWNSHLQRPCIPRKKAYDDGKI